MDRLIIGCGYLGGRVAGLWRRQGHRVFATTRSAARAEEFRAGGLEPIIGDVLQPASWKGWPHAGVVLHSIGLDRSAGRPMRDVYVNGLSHVLDALPPPGRFIFISSTSVYGQKQGEAVDEDAPAEPADESGRIVREAEQLLHQRLPEAIILRFAGIYGPGRLLRRQAIEKGEPIVGDAEKWLNLIHVDDGAAAVLAAGERAMPGGIYNICDDQPILRRDYYSLLAQLLEAPPPQFTPLPPGAPVPPYERSHRRIVNRRMHEVLEVALRYPTSEEGLRAAITPPPGGLADR